MMKTKKALKVQEFDSEERICQLIFLMDNLNFSWLVNDEQIVTWEEELKELLGVEKLQVPYIDNINYGRISYSSLFETAIYKVYSKETLPILDENELLIVWDNLKNDLNRLVFLPTKERKRFMNIVEEYDNAYWDGTYEEEQDLRYFIEREFLGLAY